MLGRKFDLQIKLLNENGFTYIGDRYIHSSGFEIDCSDLNKILDEDFEKALSLILERLKEFEEYKKKIFNTCSDILNTYKY